LRQPGIAFGIAGTFSTTANDAGQKTRRSDPVSNMEIRFCLQGDCPCVKRKEVLRLKFQLGLGLREIARSCCLGLGTVHEYLQRAKAAGVSWPLPEGWDEEKLESALFGGAPPRAADPTKAAPISLPFTSRSNGTGT
jgi:hypothetical protein